MDEVSEEDRERARAVSASLGEEMKSRYKKFRDPRELRKWMAEMVTVSI